MREFVLNDVCLGGGITVGQATEMAVDLEKGIVALIAAGHGVQSMRLAASTGEILVAPELTLADLLIHVIRTTPSGRLLSRMATKYPVEDDLLDEEFAALVEWSIPTHPGAIALVLCARSGRIAATLSRDPAWAADPLALQVQTDPASPDALTTVRIDNVHSEASGAAMAQRLDAAFIADAAPADVWRERARLYPDLLFAPRVERDLADLGPELYGAALARLRELADASRGWTADDAHPAYRSKITGESKATMNRYGEDRVFMSSNNLHETFELHARLPGGFRLHLREIAASRKLEIGYIGPHLPIASEN